MKNILVTGSSGYIGKNLIQSYEKEYRFDTFSLRKSSLVNCNLESIDVVVHCAALVHQKEQFSYEEYYKINVNYPFELARKAKENGVKQFIFLSTIAVYGDSYSFLDESTKPLPTTSYGKSKLEAEKKLQKLMDENFCVSIIRLPMVYGSNAPGNIASLIKLIQKVPLLPFADIKNRRTFIGIDNLLECLDTIIKKEISGLFLIADQESLSTTRLIELIGEALEKRVVLIKVPLFESLLKLVKPSFHKRLYGSLEVDNQDTLRRLFGKVKTSLPFSVEDGIKLMIEGEKK